MSSFSKKQNFLSWGRHSESWGQRRWYLEVGSGRSGQARISCITDRCSQRYALVNLWLQLYLARTPLCLPWTIFLFRCYLRNTRYMRRQKNIWSRNKTLCSGQGEWSLNAMLPNMKPLLNKLVLGSSGPRLIVEGPSSFTPFHPDNQ